MSDVTARGSGFNAPTSRRSQSSPARGPTPSGTPPASAARAKPGIGDDRAEARAVRQKAERHRRSPEPHDHLGAGIVRRVEEVVAAVARVQREEAQHRHREQRARHGARPTCFERRTSASSSGASDPA